MILVHIMMLLHALKSQSVKFRAVYLIYRTSKQRNRVPHQKLCLETCF